MSSTKMLVSVCGASAILGFFCGLYYSRKWTKKQKEDGKVRVNSCVLFFPDNQTAASQDLTRQEKGQIYKEILNYSRPLKQLEKVLKSAKVSIDLCLFTITCHKLGFAALGNSSYFVQKKSSNWSEICTAQLERKQTFTD